MRMHVFRLPLLLLALFVYVAPLQAKNRHPEYHSYVPPPNEAYITVSPDALPSASLQPFLDTHLDRILTPLGKEEFDQPWIVTRLRADYAAIMATAADNRKPAFAAAQFVCDALTNAMTEREQAVNAWHGSAASHSSEGVQPHGGRKLGRQEMGDENSFFQHSVENNWVQRAAALRENVLRLDQREHAAETTPVARPVPVAPVAPTVADVISAVATPSVSAPPPASPPSSVQAADPVVGPWMLEGRSPLMLAADHAITGSREGIWTYTGTTGGGRNYELHWSHKDWVDYLVLSSDGKNLDGHTRGNQPISASRP